MQYKKMYKEIMLDPPIKYATFGSTRLAMILGNADENVWNWFYSNHIQLYFNERILSHGGTDHRIQFVSFKDNCHRTFVEERLIKDEDYCFDSRIVDNCKKWLEEGYYVQPYIDATKLRNTGYIHTRPGAHSVFIYGYDEQNRILTILDYNPKGQFVPINVSEDDLEEGFSSEHLNKDLIKKGWADKCFVKLYKIVHKDYNFDINEVVKQLKNYERGLNDIKMDVPVIKGVNNASFGISVYDSMIDYIKNNQKTKIDIRAFRAFVEHKEVMVKRLEYMMKKGYDIDEQLISAYKEIEKKAKQMVLVVLKYNKGDKEKMEQVCNMLTQTSKKEFDVIYNILGRIDL